MLCNVSASPLFTIASKKLFLQLAWSLRLHLLSLGMLQIQSHCYLVSDQGSFFFGEAYVCLYFMPLCHSVGRLIFTSRLVTRQITGLRVPRSGLKGSLPLDVCDLYHTSATLGYRKQQRRGISKRLEGYTNRETRRVSEGVEGHTNHERSRIPETPEDHTNHERRRILERPEDHTHHERRRVFEIPEDHHETQKESETLQDQYPDHDIKSTAEKETPTGHIPQAHNTMSDPRGVPMADYTHYSTAALIERISSLERQLREQTARVPALSGQHAAGGVDIENESSTSAKQRESTTASTTRASERQWRNGVETGSTSATERQSGNVVKGNQYTNAVGTQSTNAVAATAAATGTLPLGTDPRTRSRSRSRSQSPSRRARPFDPTQYSTRHIALKFAYLGGRYNGYEHANGNVLPMPTIEEVLWKALRKTRLISPPVAEGADASMDVVWEKEKRLRLYTDGKSGGRDEAQGKVRLDLSWEGCQYSKCGRTDRGVSAFGQVIGIRVRSNRPIEQDTKRQETALKGSSVSDHKTESRLDRLSKESEINTSTDTELYTSSTDPATDMDDAMLPPIDDDDVDDIDTDADANSHHEASFHPIKDELSYVTMLNAILPPDIRVLAWCPDPPPNFDARFSCRERRYRYFFTNPAFCPTPGPKGMRYADGIPASRREGWLDITKMREAAKKLEGLHDFRNLCKIDPSKQMPSCERRITFADVVECEQTGKVFSLHPALNEAGGGHGSDPNGISSSLSSVDDALNARHDSVLPSTSSSPSSSLKACGPKVYAFCVNGSAFLWHQVRCMVAVLFLVGQGLEEPSIIDELLNVEKNPGRPMYEMADDAPLVLWDCIFPDEDDGTGGGDGGGDHKDNPKIGSVLTDSLNWIYAGDQATLPALPGKYDGKFGSNGVVEEVWTQWREAKIQEVLAGSLLDLVVRQGDGTALERVTERDLEYASHRRQKVFDGGNAARLAGRYVPVMKKPRMDALHVQNSRWLNGRKMRRDQARGGELG